jgi:hypothetical protein
VLIGVGINGTVQGYASLHCRRQLTHLRIIEVIPQKVAHPKVVVFTGEKKVGEKIHALLTLLNQES